MPVAACDIAVAWEIRPRAMSLAPLIASTVPIRSLSAWGGGASFDRVGTVEDCADRRLDCPSARCCHKRVGDASGWLVAGTGGVIVAGTCGLVATDAGLDVTAGVV